jgi:tripartite-type tricarboxylate transporter receptor subunit TctC
MLQRRMSFIILLGALVASASPLDSHAAATPDYPNKPIRLIAPTAGGAVDFYARVLAPAVSASVKQQVIVDNRGGGSGVIAVETVIRANPDGHTLLIYGPPAWMLPLLRKSVTYDVIKDLAPIVLLNNSGNILVVHPSVPAKTVKELVDLAKAKPGHLLDAGSDTGSSAHLAAELFKAMAGVNIVRVPYKGVGAGIAALIAGEVQIMMPAIAAAMPHIKSGRLRALGVSFAEPSSLAPGIPTIASTGVPGYVSQTTGALFAPKATPAVIISKLNQEFNRALASAEVREKFLNAGAEPAGGPPSVAVTAIKAEISKWGKLIRDLGIQEE